jgi:hypothetical protein
MNIKFFKLKILCTVAVFSPGHFGCPGVGALKNYFFGGNFDPHCMER